MAPEGMLLFSASSSSLEPALNCKIEECLSFRSLLPREISDSVSGSGKKRHIGLTPFAVGHLTFPCSVRLSALNVRPPAGILRLASFCFSAAAAGGAVRTHRDRRRVNIWSSVLVSVICRSDCFLSDRLTPVFYLCALE